MTDYDDERFNGPRNLIKTLRSKKESWEQIRNMDPERLRITQETCCWPENIEQYWNDLILRVKKCEDDRQMIVENTIQGTLNGPNQRNGLGIPDWDESCWVHYRQNLINNKFKNVDTIEIECHNILQHLDLDTKEKGPVKGLVVGYVQSGKTANMAGLISMAADRGWNTFIVLSGTIDSLRKQTRDRLYEDLNNEDINVVWQKLDHLSPDSPDHHPSTLNFSERSYARYLTVCLKNKTRLINLIKWLNLDQNKKAQMKILLIDDEADQASINTASPGKERNTINRLIVNILEGRDENDQQMGPYGAMNYVSYTATPYANFLSDGSPESLYPRDFVTLLTPPNTYFGPVELYGAPESDKNGLGVIGLEDDPYSLYGIVDVSENTDKEIVKVYDSDNSEAPKSLKESICWFICASSIMRLRGYRKPVSMLIHTSQYTDNHKTLAAVVNSYLQSTRDVIISDCERTYLKKISEFPKEELFRAYPGFGRDPSEVEDYPTFESIKDTICELLDFEIHHIKIDKHTKKPVYGNGIHLCIDNCKKDVLEDIDPDSEEELMPRIIYPSEKDLETLMPAPPFIVIGGNTLSRGLTIQGLVSTYFARPVAQADTLMQMGRWFGYRNGYELLPRIWMSEDSYKAFQIMTEVDDGLRKHIRDNYTMYTPVDFPALVRKFPKTGYLRQITSANKSRAAFDVGYNFEGTMVETGSFERNPSKLTENIKITEEFLKSLGEPLKTDLGTGLIWRNIPTEKVFDGLLTQFNFCDRLINFNELDEMRSWFDKNNNSKWNVVLAGIESEKAGIWKISDDIEMTKIERSAISDRGGIVNIKTLSNPPDRFIDIPLSDLSPEQTDYYNLKRTKPDHEWRGIRNNCELNGIPALIVYCISKDSKVAEKRKPLNVDVDVIGLCLIMPGIKSSQLRADYLQIPSSVLRGE